MCLPKERMLKYAKLQEKHLMNLLVLAAVLFHLMQYDGLILTKLLMNPDEKASGSSSSFSRRIQWALPVTRITPKQQPLFHHLHQ